ncbi:hypothetical protein vseg_003456 [Gypsophila vaccaria]
MAMIGRLVHWVYEQRNTRWVRWVNTNYLKGQDWLDYVPNTQSSWVWRRICGVKQALSSGYRGGTWNHGYSPAEGYLWLRAEGQQVTWEKVIWNSWVSPNHQVMGWLYAHGALRTNDKLLQMGVLAEGNCCLCGQVTENAEHMFLACTYSRRVAHEVQVGLRLQILPTDIIGWCLNDYSRLGIKAMTGMSLIYNIWYQRNQAKLAKQLLRPHIVADRIVRDIETTLRIRENNESI